MTARPVASFPSYRDYVSHLVRQYPEYRWLERFLAVRGREPSDTQLHLLDCVGDELRVQHVTGYTDLSDRDSVRYALENRSPEVAVRIVYVTYRQSWSINRDIVDLLGLHFNVNPLFFWGHFQSYYSAGDTLCPEDLQGWGNPVLPGFTSPLPSDQTSIELGCVYDGLSALLLDEHAPVSGGKTG
jgi:hypothetical protein